MSSRVTGFAFTVVVAVALAVVVLTSCGRQEAQSQAPMPASALGAPAPAGSVGRYQVVSIQTGPQGTVVMMLDTVEGASWIYRAPQGQAINGFWSDIPRLTYAPDYWRQVFAQQPQATPAANPAPAAPPAVFPPKK